MRKKGQIASFNSARRRSSATWKITQSEVRKSWWPQNDTWCSPSIATFALCAVSTSCPSYQRSVSYINVKNFATRNACDTSLKPQRQCWCLWMSDGSRGNCTDHNEKQVTLVQPPCKKKCTKIASQKRCAHHNILLFLHMINK